MSSQHQHRAAKMSFNSAPSTTSASIVIPEEEEEVVAPAMLRNVVNKPRLSATAAAAMAAIMALSQDQEEKTKEVELSVEEPARRVSFRNDEIDQAQEIATMVEKAVQEDDSATADSDVGATASSSSCYYKEEKAFAKPIHENITDNTNNNSNSSSGDSEHECRRGFELKDSRDRQLRKLTIIRSITRNQRQCSPELLGKLARKCSAWAAEAARVQGVWDYQDVYQKQQQPQMMTCMPLPDRTLPSMQLFPLPLKQRKRPSSDESSGHPHHQQRRVRAKLINNP